MLCLFSQDSADKLSRQLALERTVARNTIDYTCSWYIFRIGINTFVPRYIQSHPSNNQGKRVIITTETAKLLAATKSPLVVIREPGSIDNLDTLAQSDHFSTFPPLGDGVLGRLAPVRWAFVVGVDESTKSGAVAADDNDGLTNPSLDVLDVRAVGAAEGIDDVDEIGTDVAEHVDVAGRCAEGHDHGGILD